MRFDKMDDKERTALKANTCPRHVEVSPRGPVGGGASVRCFHCDSTANFRPESADMLRLELGAFFKQHRPCPAPTDHAACPCSADPPAAVVAEQMSFFPPEPQKAQGRARRR